MIRRRSTSAKTRALLADAGLGVTSSLGLNWDNDLSSETVAVVARGETLLEAVIDCNAALGSKYLVGVIYSALGKYSRPATPRGRANCVAALQRLARRAADSGITLGLEVVNRYETNLFNTAAQALDIVSEIGAPNLGVHLDTYHMNIEEDDFDEPVRLCGDKLVYVHIGESHRGYLGSGNVDFATFFRALGECGYAGPIAFESCRVPWSHPHFPTRWASGGISGPTIAISRATPKSSSTGCEHRRNPRPAARAAGPNAMDSRRVQRRESCCYGSVSGRYRIRCGLAASSPSRTILFASYSV